VRTIETPWPERVLVAADLDALDAWFTMEERAAAAALPLEKRRSEWLLSRAAAKALAIRLGIARDPRTCAPARPHLVVEGRETGWYVSLSHSTPYAGAAIARAPVGVDVQVVRDLSDAAAHLFLTKEEEMEMRSCALPYRLLHFWCAKEAAWKRLGGSVATLRGVPVRLLSASDSGLTFDIVETALCGDAIVALTRE
jgi:4'-phosphopantetheinyl transferase